MTEPTITCPKCKTEIKLTESLAAPLIESTRQQFEQQLAQKDSDIAQREQGVREKEKQLAETKDKLDEQVAIQVEEQLKRTAPELQPKRPGRPNWRYPLTWIKRHRNWPICRRCLKSATRSSRKHKKHRPS